MSKRAVAKIVQVIDRLMQRNEKFILALSGNCIIVNSNATADGSSTNSAGNDTIGTSGNGSGGNSGTGNSRSGSNNSTIFTTNTIQLPEIENMLKKSQIEIMTENKNLQNLNTSLHEKYHTISLKLKELQDTLTGKETEAAELHNQIDDLQYELGKIRLRNDKLENHLAEAIEKLKSYHQIHGAAGELKSSSQSAASSSTAATSVKSSSNTTNVATQHLEELQKDVEEHRELANNRLQELDKLHQTHRETLKEVEKLKMDVSILKIFKLYRKFMKSCTFLFRKNFFEKSILHNIWTHAPFLFGYSSFSFFLNL